MNCNDECREEKFCTHLNDDNNNVGLLLRLVTQSCRHSLLVVFSPYCSSLAYQRHQRHQTHKLVDYKPAHKFCFFAD